jgi:CHAT domain-containing protein
VSRANTFRCIAKHLGTLWVFTGILYLWPGALANVAAPCNPLLTAKPTFFTTTLQLTGGARVTRDIAVPLHSQVLVIASETGLGITLEVLSGGRVIGRSASPVSRTGSARLTLRTQSDAKTSLVVTAKGDPGVRGQVAIRAFLVDADAANDRCLRAQMSLASADSHYAQAQAATIDNTGDSNTDARREYKAAADQYQAAASQTSAPALQAYAEHALAELLYNWVDDWTGARSWAQTAARTYEREGDRYGEARARAIEADAAMEIAQTFRSSATGSEGVQRAATELRQVREELSSLATFHARRGELLDQALALNDIGNAYLDEGLNDSAIQSFRSTLPIFEKLGEETWKTIVRQDIALAGFQLGRVYDAIAEYKRLLQAMPESADPSTRAMTLNNSALANWAAGHMDVALRQYFEALQLERKMQDNREQARSLLGIGSVYDALGDPDQALDFYRQSQSLRSAELDARGRVASLRRMANVLRSQGQAQKALEMHSEALSLASIPAERVSIQIQRARDLEDLGQNDSALQQLESVMRERSAGRKVVQAEALLERAKIRIATGQLVAAEADLHSAIATFADGESPVDEFSSWVALAQAQRKRGSTRQALDSLAHALKLAEEVRLQSASPELRASLLQPLRPAFDLKIALLAAAYFTPSHANTATQREQSALDALSTAEQARARAFEDFERLDVGVSPAEALLLERRREIYHELQARHFQLQSRRDQTADDDERVRGIRADISALRAQLDATEGQIHASASRPGAKAATESWTLDRRSIPADTAIVEYWLGAENATAWVVTHDKLTMVDLGPSAKITEAAQAYHDSVHSFGKVPASRRLEDSARLYASVIQPLERSIATYHSLIFAPDGALHYIPFAALRATGPDRPGFLIENHDVAMTPSIRSLLERRARTTVPVTRGDRLLLVADPVYTADDDRLRSAAASRNADSKETDIRSRVFGSANGASLPRLTNTAPEAAAIAALFAPDQVVRLQGFAATKNRFLAEPLDRYRVIHVASHATTNAQIPGLSALALSAFDPTGARIVDDLVFAADFMTLRLNADLVVLSACDTALGKNVAGEGLMGLRYITLARGAGAVVASLWEVPDESTSELMSAFYRSYLADHKSVTAALSEAMRTMLGRSNTDLSEWGSFTATISALADLR